MPEDFSRRGFLTGLAAGGATLALGPSGAAAASSEASASGGAAVVQPVHPWIELRPAADPIRVLVAVRLAPAELDQMRQAAAGVGVVRANEGSDRHRRAPAAAV